MHPLELLSLEEGYVYFIPFLIVKKREWKTFYIVFGNLVFSGFMPHPFSLSGFLKKTNAHIVPRAFLNTPNTLEHI